jgi:diguanylate cyclase (GGDEF)-like protein
VAERIRRLVANTIFEGEHGEPIRLTISIGVASFPEHGDQRDALLDLADKAMYLAKSQGRDCVCSASDLG